MNPKHENNMETVLTRIRSEFGLRTMANGKTLISIFCDLSQVKQDQRLLRYLVEVDGHKALLEMEKLSPAMQQTRFQQTVNKLCTEMLVSEEAARQVCTAFCNAVSGSTTVFTIQQTQEKESVPKKETTGTEEPVKAGKTPVREVSKPKDIPQEAHRPRMESVSTEVRGKLSISRGIAALLSVAALLIVLFVIILPSLPEKTKPVQTSETVKETIEQTGQEALVQRAELRGVLRSDETPSTITNESDHPVFGSSLMRSQVGSIRFENTLENAPQEGVVDVSANGDGSVLSWIKANGNLVDLYIAAEGGVKAPENCSGLFALYKNTEVIDFNNSFDTSDVTNMNSMFLYCQSARKITTEQMDTSNVINMGRMFDFCKSLTELNVGSFNTAKVRVMSFMFNWCESLTELDVSNFDTSNVELASYMFYACTGLQSLKLDDFDTSRMETLSSMFGSCGSLKKLDVSSFNTAKVTDMGGMFEGCSSLTSLNVSNFDTSNVEDMSYMFYRCTGLLTLDLRNFDTSNVTNMSGMFYNCQNLSYLDLNSFNVSKVTEFRNFMENGKTIAGQPWEKFFTA